MFNRHHEDQREQNNYQAVTVNLAGGYSRQSAPLASLAMFGMAVVLVAGLAVVVYRLIVDTVEILAGVVVALLSAVVALVPWLAGCAVLFALCWLALREVPQALAEAQDLRYRLAAQRHPPKMLEVKHVDDTVVILRPVRPVITIEHEQQ